MSRHTARIHALNLVFQFPFHAEWDHDMLEKATNQYLLDLPDLDEHIKNTSPGKDDRAFIVEEAIGTFDNLEQIDIQIGERLVDWELNRIARIDLALLRLASYEILYVPYISTATAINEAVELAKVYGTEESPGFINGVLGKVASTKDKQDKQDKQDNEDKQNVRDSQVQQLC